MSSWHPEVLCFIFLQAPACMHLLFSCHYRSPQIFAYFSRLDPPLTFSYTISQSTAYPGSVAQSPRALIKSQPWDLPVGTVYSHSLALSVHLRACGQGSVAYSGSSFQAQCVPCAGTGLSTIIISFPPFPSVLLLFSVLGIHTRLYSFRSRTTHRLVPVYIPKHTRTHTCKYIYTHMYVMLKFLLLELINNEKALTCCWEEMCPH